MDPWSDHAVLVTGMALDSTGRIAQVEIVNPDIAPQVADPAGSGGYYQDCCQNYDPPTAQYADNLPDSVWERWISDSYIHGEAFFWSAYTFGPPGDEGTLVDVFDALKGLVLD